MISLFRHAKKPLKILVVASPWVGGSGSVGFELAKFFSKNNQVFFLSYDFPSRNIRDDDHFVFLNMVPEKYALFSDALYTTSLTERIVNIVRKYNISIIHAHYGIVFGESAIVAKKILAAEKVRVKVVLTFHGTDIIGFDATALGRNTFHSINQWLIDQSDAITVASDFLRNFIMRSYKVSLKKIKVIPNFYDSHVFHAQPSQKRRDYLIHVSNFRKVKQPLEAVKAFELVAQWHYKLKLVLVGDGPEKEKVRQYVAKKKLKRIILLPPKNAKEIAMLLSKSIACILPSLFENSPMVMFESLACGVPLIATDVGGVGEVITHKQNGFLVRNALHPAPEIAEKISVFAKENDTWRQMSANAVASSQNYQIDVAAEKYLNLYHAIS